jgi:transcriptional regulator with XRE-family HTH domain
MKEEREAFSRRLAQAMRDAGLEARPSVLAREFNLRFRGEPVSFQSASRWLHGRSIPTQDKLRLLAKLLGLEPHVLRFGTTTSAIAESPAAWHAGLKSQDHEMIEAYLALPASRRKLVRDLVTALRS